ncbi:MAG TPA: hypothetical protein VJO32_05485 [Ktedonobacteraceae bacterium]|nr:hypothetical protein [Ktedonobacteraceae bacterium]
MKKVVTIVEKNGVEHTVSLTAEQADYYLRLAQMRASSPDDVMREFSNLIIKKSQQDARRSKAQYN